ncbi:MAG: ribonuclease HI family protein [Actinomycetota bacterium]
MPDEREAGDAVYRLRSDGAARGNPGPAGIGVVLESPDGTVIAERAAGIGWATNNVAEYRALLDGLELARDHNVRRLVVFADSRLLVEQMKGAFRVKHQGLKPLFDEALRLARLFDEVRYVAVPREQNRHADRLANEGIDQSGVSPRRPPSFEQDVDAVEDAADDATSPSPQDPLF